MITISRKENKVIIHVKDGTFPFDNSGFSLEIIQDYPYQAELLKRQIQKNMDENLKRIKRDMYHRGWKDALKRGVKVSDRKVTEFYGGWQSEF